tara:strand:+ start:188 stop:1054 length:867 start_codon:yes stop_codon:yes gene_type:complete
MIDAHHHLWDLSAIRYPWLEEKSVMRFFGDPTAIQKNYLMSDFRSDCQSHGFWGSVHIQVGAEDPIREANWVDGVSSANSDWSMRQVVYCDLTEKQMPTKLDLFQKLPSVAGVRQILSRAPGIESGSVLLDNITSPIVLENLRELSRRQLSFDLQLIPEVMGQFSFLLQKVPELKIAICHAGSPHDRTAPGIRRWQSALRFISSLPNTSCKISGLGMFQHNWTIEDFKVLVETCLEQFGSKRCMFGSNFPVDSLYSDYNTLINTFKILVPNSLHKAFFENTARKFYHI